MHDPARDAFGRRLRRERESRGITLRHIADSTKIKASLLADLEAGDVSKWPQGIYRRAYLCSYLSAIGVAAQPALAEFTKLFPDVDDTPAVPFHGIGLNTAEPVDFASPFSDLLDRMWVAAFDLAAICLLSSLAALITGLNLSLTMAFTAVFYVACGSVMFGRAIGGEVRFAISGLAQASRLPETTKAQTPVARLVVAGKIRENRPALEIELSQDLSSRRVASA